MAAIDSLLGWAQTSERMHQLILAQLLGRTKLLSYLLANFEIHSEIEKESLEIEARNRLYDFGVKLETGQQVYGELKVNSSLGEEQIERQAESLSITDPSDILIYFLIGTTQFSWSIERIRKIAGEKKGDLEPSSILLVNSDVMQDALLHMLADSLDRNDDRDLSVVYLSHLQKLKKSYEEYKELPLNDWTLLDHWYGFFNELDKRLGAKAFIGYVPNQSGGFCCFAWCTDNVPGFPGAKAYLQLESNKLCFKVAVPDIQIKTAVRSKLSESVLDAWQELKKQSLVSIDVRRPKRFGSGWTMTVAEVECDYRSSINTSESKHLDMDHCTKSLKEAQDILGSALKRL
jgi:hypothetical protein